MEHDTKNDKIINIIEKSINEIIRGEKVISINESLKEKDINKKYIYNETSFQYELGILLRERFNELNKKDNRNKYMVQFERNINTFTDININEVVKNHIETDKENKNEFNNLNEKDKKRRLFRKSEIDIVIVNSYFPKERYAIELKYHYKSMGELPNYMYNCIKDISFAKALYRELKFCYTVCVTVVEDENFFGKRNKNTRSNNYLYFKYYKDEEEKEKLKNEIENKGTPDILHSKKEKIRVKEFVDAGILPVRWESISDEQKGKYYMVSFGKE